jgi:hypothetical protein
LSSSSSRDRLTTSELHPSRSPPRLFPRLLHRSALVSRSPSIGVHPPQTAASTSGYPTIRRPTASAVTYRSRVANLREAPPSVFLAISRTLQTYSHAGSLDPCQGRSLLVPKRPHRSSRPRALSVPSRAPRFPIHPTLLRHSRFATRATWGQRTSSGGLSGLFLDAHDPQVTLGMDTQHQHPSLSRTFPSPISRLPFAFPSALFDHQDFVHTTPCGWDHHRSSATRHRVFLPRPAPLPPNSHDPHPLPSLHRALRVSGIDTRNVDLGGETVFR